MERGHITTKFGRAGGILEAKKIAAIAETYYADRTLFRASSSGRQHSTCHRDLEFLNS